MVHAVDRYGGLAVEVDNGGEGIYRPADFPFGRDGDFPAVLPAAVGEQEGFFLRQSQGFEPATDRDRILKIEQRAVGHGHLVVGAVEAAGARRVVPKIRDVQGPAAGCAVQLMTADVVGITQKRINTIRA